jgi:uncharacterized membrane protein
MSSARRSVFVLALLGLAIAAYLAAYQLHLTTMVWDPLFGAASSEAVVDSPLSRMLPVPDAAVGAGAYACEAALAAITNKRQRSQVTFAALVLVLALAGVGLLLTQAFVVHAFCTLCLLSALISFINVVLARDEVGAILHVFTPDARRSIAT